jgi:hypothetical protein
LEQEICFNSEAFFGTEGVLHKLIFYCSKDIVLECQGVGEEGGREALESHKDLPVAETGGEDERTLLATRHGAGAVEETELPRVAWTGDAEVSMEVLDVSEVERGALVGTRVLQGEEGGSMTEEHEGKAVELDGGAQHGRILFGALRDDPACGKTQVRGRVHG